MGNTLCFDDTAARIALRLIGHEFAGCEHAAHVAYRLQQMLDDGYFTPVPSASIAVVAVPADVIEHAADTANTNQPEVPPFITTKRRAGR